MIDGTSYAFTQIPDFVKVGKYCSIASDVKFITPWTHLCIVNRKCVFTTNWDQPMQTKDVIIKNDVWIGEGVVILPGVTIGNGAIIGAYAVVGSDVPDYTIAIGNPWRVLRKRFDDNQIKALLAIAWWDWDDDKVKQNKELMKNVEEFIKKYE